MSEHLKHLVIYWHSKDLNAIQIYQKCCKNFPDESIHYSSITNWIRKIKRGENILVRKIGSGPLSDETIDLKIYSALNEFPFHSLRSLSTCLKIPKSTIHDHLKKMGFIVKHLRYVPHILNSDQKMNRVKISKQLLDEIAEARDQSWRFFLTGDESWFFFIEDFDIQWVAPGEKPFTRSKRIISSPKRMLTVFWSPLGFRIIEMLPKGTRFNSKYFINEILSKIAEIHNQENPNSRRRFVVHMDNATPHRSKETQTYGAQNKLRFCEHPAFSPDLAPSDFYLFGKVKNALKGSEFQCEQELFESVVQILTQITREELESVMDEWEKRLRACISANGDYFD